ncbi:PKD domain-containing protein [Kordiimonas sp. SCSIO 12610]|uniref:PKD domain-containing protein n=1 Tax=Kordiimonas sp. SCSIO 12610 TaxID=2829597 RepID=UPI00210E2212|nr:PKD domain-containing protein [Kordiimonas sp. SCSIO 12610]UTW53966.1 right-handed parallel beta-helix repeat-containing protein [Kordiimonas sp. SCSIO 12610]
MVDFPSIRTFKVTLAAGEETRVRSLEAVEISCISMTNGAEGQITYGRDNQVTGVYSRLFVGYKISVTDGIPFTSYKIRNTGTVDAVFEFLTCTAGAKFDNSSEQGEVRIDGRVQSTNPSIRSATRKVLVGAVPVEILAEDLTRQSATIQVDNTTIVFGPDDQITFDDGIPYLPGIFTDNNTASLWAVRPAGSAELEIKIDEQNFSQAFSSAPAGGAGNQPVSNPEPEPEAQPVAQSALYGREAYQQPVISATSTVTNTAELIAAFDAAAGGEIIELAAGNYGDWQEAGHSFASPVTIRGAFGADIEFARLRFNGVDNVKFENIKITDSIRAGESRVDEMATFQNCDDITLEYYEISGNEADAYNNRYDAIDFIDCNRGKLLKGNIHHVNGGAQFTRGSGHRVNENYIGNVRHDGLIFANVQDVEIIDNVFGQFITDPTNVEIHAGLIQFFTVGSPINNEDVIIRGNICLQDLEENFPLGGFFFTGDNAQGSRNVRFLVEDNLIYTRDADSITLGQATDCTVRRNTVISPLYGPDNTGIRVDDDNINCVITDNLGYSIIEDAGGNNVGTVLTGNIEAQRIDVGADDYINKLIFSGNTGATSTFKDFLPRPDGLLSTGANPVGWGHNYNAGGLVALLAVDQGTGATGLDVTIDAQYTRDQNGVVPESDAVFSIDWGDGSPNENLFQGSHSYADSGTYTITLTVTKDGVMDTHSHPLTVVSPQVLSNSDLFVADAGRQVGSNPITGITFDGTHAQGIDLGNDERLYGFRGLYLEMEFTPERGATAASGVIETGTSYPLFAANRYQMTLNFSRVVFGVHDGTSFKSVTTSGSAMAADGINLFDGQPHKIVAVWGGDAGTLTITVDDTHTQSIATDVGQMPSGAGADNVYIGRQENDGGRSFKGTINKLELYSSTARPDGFNAGTIGA